MESLNITGERMQREEQDLLAVSVSVTEAASISRASQQHVRRLMAAGEALSFSYEGYLLLPSWQFRSNAIDHPIDNAILPGIPELAEVFPDDIVSMHAWLNQPHDALDGQTPIETMHCDHPANGSPMSDYIVALAKATGATGI